VSGGAAITAAGRMGWPAVNVMLGLLYLPILFITWKAPEPEERTPAPASLREAVWHPFLGFLARHRALEILAFVFLYKFADQLTQALTRPFLIDMGYNADHRGIALATVGLFATIVGALIGGWVTTLIGLGHSLWVFGFLQIFSNLGYYFVSTAGGVVLPLMYGAAGFELLTGGLEPGLLGAAAAHDTEAVLGHAVRAVLQPLRAARLLAGRSRAPASMPWAGPRSF